MPMNDTVVEKPKAEEFVPPINNVNGLMDVTPVVYTTPEVSKDNVASRSGWLTVFHGEHLHREIYINVRPGRTTYADVDFKTEQGLN